MKITVDRRMLEAALSKTSGAIEEKANLPVLKCVLLEFDGEQLCISGTNLDQSMRTRIKAAGDDPGRTAMPAKKLLEIARTTSNDIISIDADGVTRAKIKAGKSKYEIPQMAPEDFPTVDVALTTDPTRCEAFPLCSALSRIFHAIPAEDDTFAAPGAFLHARGDHYRFVASDGHRLAYAQVPVDRLPGMDIPDRGIVIPRPAVKQMLKMLDKATDARIEGNAERVAVEAIETSLSTRLLDADFPEYEVIVPQSFTATVQIPRAELLDVLKRLTPALSKDFNHVRIWIELDSIRLETGSPEEGSAEESIKIDYSGPDFGMALNLAYVRDAVSACVTDVVTFSWVDQYHGGVFGEPDNPDFLALIMPMVV